jgi:hypothetical protein
MLFFFPAFSFTVKEKAGRTLVRNKKYSVSENHTLDFIP